MTSDARLLRDMPGQGVMDGIPPGRLRIGFRAATLASLFFFLTSIPFIAFGVLPDRFAWTASPVLLLYASTTLLSELRHGRPRFSTVTAVLLWASFFLIEAVGVRTGVPFGDYSYTEVLGLAVAGVPVAISAAWYAAIINAWRLSEWLNASTRGAGWRIPLVAATLTLGFDVALEPMAARVQKYWLWTGGGIPLENYVSWFVLSLVAVAALRRLHPPDRRTVRGAGMTGALLYGIQIVLFLITAIVHDAAAHAAGAMLLIALGVALARWRGGSNSV